MALEPKLDCFSKLKPRFVCSLVLQYRADLSGKIFRLRFSFFLLSTPAVVSNLARDPNVRRTNVIVFSEPFFSPFRGFVSYFPGMQKSFTRSQVVTFFIR